jgi:hypothetical protein
MIFNHTHIGLLPVGYYYLMGVKSNNRTCSDREQSVIKRKRKTYTEHVKKLKPDEIPFLFTADRPLSKKTGLF